MFTINVKPSADCQYSKPPVADSPRSASRGTRILATTHLLFRDILGKCDSNPEIFNTWEHYAPFVDFATSSFRLTTSAMQSGDPGRGSEMPRITLGHEANIYLWDELGRYDGIRSLLSNLLSPLDSAYAFVSRELGNTPGERYFQLRFGWADRSPVASEDDRVSELSVVTDHLRNNADGVCLIHFANYDNETRRRNRDGEDHVWFYRRESDRPIGSPIEDWSVLTHRSCDFEQAKHAIDCALKIPPSLGFLTTCPPGLGLSLNSSISAAVIEALIKRTKCLFVEAFDSDTLVFVEVVPADPGGSSGSSGRGRNGHC